MKVAGYRLNGYNATYEEVLFDVRDGINAEKNCVLDVTEIMSGVTYIFEYEPKMTHKKHRNPAKKDLQK